jgi:hypothetical protein
MNHRIPTGLLLAAVLACPAIATAGSDPHAGHDHASHDHAAHDHAAHDHAGHDHGGAGLELDDGKRWQTDASLREGMQRVRTALQTAHAAHAGQPAPAAEHGRALAAELDAAIGFMIAHCNLPPKADASLHVLIGRLAQASSTLKQQPTSIAAVGEISAVLDTYPQYFDHPGWSEAGDAHHDHNHHHHGH